MKVFLDTNVWLSARFRPGLCAQLLDALLEAGVDVLLDARVHEEFMRIAGDKLGVDETLLARADLFFQKFTEILPAAEQPAAGIPDPDDAWIIAAALVAGADWFVTGDKALLDLGAVEGLPLLGPRTAYERLCGLG